MLSVLSFVRSIDGLYQYQQSAKMLFQYINISDIGNGLGPINDSDWSFSITLTAVFFSVRAEITTKDKQEDFH